MAFNNNQINLKPSRILLVLLSGLHVGAISILLFLKFPWYMIFILSAIIIYSLIFVLKRDVFFIYPQAIVQCWQEGSGEWMLKNKQGDLQQAELLGSSFRSTYLIILNFKIIDKRSIRSVIILPDSIDTDSFRRLRVQLLVLKTPLPSEGIGKRATKALTKN